MHQFNNLCYIVTNKVTTEEFMPRNPPKDILTLAAELIKHQAKKQLGDGFIDTLSKQLVDYAGDNVSEKVNGW